jgi:hypothetical protein
MVGPNISGVIKERLPKISDKQDFNTQEALRMEKVVQRALHTQFK